MSKRTYTPEFKREVLARAAQGEKSIPELERDLGITPGLVHKWRRRYRVDGVDQQLVASEEREVAAEIRRLKREVEVLRQERDVLKKPSRSSRGANSYEVCVHRATPPVVSGHTVVYGAGRVE